MAKSDINFETKRYGESYSNAMKNGLVEFSETYPEAEVHTIHANDVSDNCCVSVVWSVQVRATVEH